MLDESSGLWSAGISQAEIVQIGARQSGEHAEMLARLVEAGGVTFRMIGAIAGCVVRVLCRLSVLDVHPASSAVG